MQREEKSGRILPDAVLLDPVLLGALEVVVGEGEQEGVGVGFRALGEGQGFAGEPGQAVAQGEVKAFDVAALARLLGTGAVRRRGKTVW